MKNVNSTAILRFVCGFCLMAITYSGAATYYVSPAGNNSAAGTIDAPFATLQKGHDKAVAGDTVFIRAGTYTFKSQIFSANAGVQLSKSGTSDSKRIYFWAYPGEKPKFDFTGMAIATSTSAGIYVTGSFLHIKGLEICNLPQKAKPASAANDGLWCVGGSNNIFELLDSHNNMGPGICIANGNGGHLVLNCDSHDNYDPNSSQGDGQNADGFGCHYQTSGTSTIFRGCRSWWNSDDGWDFISQEFPVIIENCWAMGMGYFNSGTTKAPSGNGNGVKAGSSKNGIRHTIRNCVSWKNKANGFYANHSAGGNDWYNNTSYNNGSQFDLLASSWDASGNRTDGITLTGTKAHVMRNNIGFPNDNANMNGVDSKNNTWDLNITPSENDFLSVSDVGVMTGPRKADGSLPSLTFMKLKLGSQMIDKGINVSLPFTGAAPDLGAFEYGTTPIAAPTTIALAAKAFGVVVKGKQIQCSFPQAGTKRFEVLDLQGKTVFSRVTNEALCTWNPGSSDRNVAAATYIIRATYQGESFFKSVFFQGTR